MEIERLLQIETIDFDKIEMIISNNLDLMYKGKACVTIDNWDKLTNEILLWHESKVKNLALSGVSQQRELLMTVKKRFDEAIKENDLIVQQSMLYDLFHGINCG